MPVSDFGRTYDVLLVPGFAMMSYSCACEPLRAANVLASRRIYRWRHLSPDGGPVTASNGMQIAVDSGLDDGPAASTLLVCAGGNPAEFDDPATFGWLRGAARKGLRLGGISGGPYILVRAGLLDGSRATVH